MQAALFLDGRAPTIISYQAGALVAFHHKNIEFDLISATGFGAIPALVYAAPKASDRGMALSQITELALSDELYQTVGYNTLFFKQSNPLPWAYTAIQNVFSQVRSGDPNTTKIADEWINLAFRTMLPFNIARSDTGLFLHGDWLEQMVNFENVKQLQYELYLNTFNITRSTVQTFSKTELTPKHALAAVSTPFIYSPMEINGEKHMDASLLDSVCVQSVMEYRKIVQSLGQDNIAPDKIIILEPLRGDKFYREPGNLTQAFKQATVAPAIEKHNNDIGLLVDQNLKQTKTGPIVIKMPQDGDIIDHLMNWRRSSAEKLFELGYLHGIECCDVNFGRRG